MEGKSFLYAPSWVKVLSLSILTAALLTAIAIILFYVGQQKSDWILVAISLAQIAASGIVFALIFFYSARDVNAASLQKRTERLLLEQFPRACRAIDEPSAPFKPWHRWSASSSQSKTQVEISYSAGDIDATYRVHALGQILHMRLEVNIKQVAISYYVPAETEEEANALREKLSWAFSWYREVLGYSYNDYFSTEAFDGRTYFSAHLLKEQDFDFLEDERKKMFFVNNVVMNTRGIIKDCNEKGIRLSREG